MKKILNLTLEKKWFDLTASGKKLNEYREFKKHWNDRLSFKSGSRIGFKEFDEIHYTNGYGKDKPFCRVAWQGTSIIHWPLHESSIFYPKHGEPLKDIAYYVLINGKVLETRNWNKNTSNCHPKLKPLPV